MLQRSTALAIGVVVAVSLAVPGVGAAGGGVVAQTNGTNDTNASEAVSPGERLSGVVGVQSAELEGEVEKRTFGLKVARAASDDARAQVVNEQLGDLEQRVATLGERRQALEQARANGSMSGGEYAARVSELTAESRTVSDLANDTDETASGLPADVLEANGVNVSAIQQLRNNASGLTGPEVAEIARSIAGPNVGQAPTEVPAGGDRPGDAGPPENATDGDGAADTPTGAPDGQDAQGGQDTRDGNTTGAETETDTRDGSDRGSGSDAGGR